MNNLTRENYITTLGESMKKDQELTVITKTYDLILWSCNHTGNSPATTASCWANGSNGTSENVRRFRRRMRMDAAGVRPLAASVSTPSAPHHELDRSCPPCQHLSLAERSIA